MKDLSAELTTHLEGDVTTIATGWRVIRKDGGSFGWVDHDEDITIDGVLYRASGGLKPTATHSTNDFAVDTLDVTAFLDVSTEEEMSAEVWDGAQVTVFEFNWDDPPTLLGDETVILRHGTLGQITRQNTIFTAEIRGLSQRLATRIGRAYSPTCPWRHALWSVADNNYVSSVECNLQDLGPFIYTGTITSVTSQPRLEFDDTAVLAPQNFFDEGIITFNTGNNANLSREVRRWENGRFSLYREFPYDVEVGDDYTAIRGDDKTYITCRDIFDNLVNPVSGGFGGFPFMPGIHNLLKNPVGF